MGQTLRHRAALTPGTGRVLARDIGLSSPPLDITNFVSMLILFAEIGHQMSWLEDRPLVLELGGDTGNLNN